MGIVDDWIKCLPKAMRASGVEGGGERREKRRLR
jgi:hypothetical protein